MLLSEQVRKFSEEELLLEDTSTYVRKVCGWALVHDYGDFTLEEASLVMLHYRVDYADVGGSNGGSNHRIWFKKSGGADLLVGGGPINGPQGGGKTGPAGDIYRYVWLTAGTYTVQFEGAADRYDGNNYFSIKVTELRIAKISFSDVEAPVALQEVTDNQQFTFTLPARVLGLGDIQYAILHVAVAGYNYDGVDYFSQNYESIGDNYGRGIELWVDGNRVDWTNPRHDDVTGEDCSLYGGSAARAAVKVSAGVQHTVELDIEDAANSTVFMSAIVTPWILKDELFEPISLDCPQGSTVYLVTEPLLYNPTQSVKIGGVRGFSFGDSTDYYYTNSGTGILESDYTFEKVDITQSILKVKGFGSCISIIEVDVR